MLKNNKKDTFLASTSYAYKPPFKPAVRDRWIGWSAERQFRRLHLIADDSRFVILSPRRTPDLASRVLGLSPRRLSADIEAAHGYPVFPAETSAAVPRFGGTCRRALPLPWPAKGDFHIRTDRRRRRGAEPGCDPGKLECGAARQRRADGRVRAAQLVRVFRRSARVPQALSAENRAGDRRHGPARQLPRRDCVRSVRSPPHPEAARGGSLVLQPVEEALRRACDRCLP